MSELAQVRQTLQNGLDRDKDNTTTPHLAVVAINSIKDLKDSLARAKEVIEWYADPETWSPWEHESFYNDHTGASRSAVYNRVDAEEDRGKKARMFLGLSHPKPDFPAPMTFEDFELAVTQIEPPANEKEERNDWATKIAFENLLRERDELQRYCNACEVILTAKTSDFEKLVDERDALREQIHNLCHDLHLKGPVTPQEFCDGCEKYQQLLFKESPIADLRAERDKWKARAEKAETRWAEGLLTQITSKAG